MKLPPHPLLLQRRIEFSDTDAAGLVHFTTYFKLMEAAEADLFRNLELSLIWRDETGCYGFPRVDSHCKYRAPLHFDDQVTIQLKLDLLDGHRLHYTSSFKDESGNCCATGSMTTAFAIRDKSGALRSLPLPESYSKTLSMWKNQDA